MRDKSEQKFGYVKVKMYLCGEKNNIVYETLPIRHHKSL